MRVLLRFGVLVATSLLAALPVSSQAADFSQTVTFGDSLTHNRLLGFPFRTALYGDDPMEAVFDKGAASGDRFTSYAIAGSTSEVIRTQIVAYALRYLAGAQEPATMISFEIGGNDVLDAWSLLSADPPGVDPAADALIDRLIRTLVTDLSVLWYVHPDAVFVLWTVPDITFTPRHWIDRNTTRGANFRAHLARVNDLLRRLDAVPNIVVLDTAALLRDLTTDPPVIAGQQLAGPPATGLFAGLFADDIHPTAVANALVANGIIDRANAERGAGIPEYTDPELAALARLP